MPTKGPQNTQSGMVKAPRSINNNTANMKASFGFFGIVFWIVVEIWTLFHLSLVWSAMTHTFNWLATF